MGLLVFIFFGFSLCFAFVFLLCCIDCPYLVLFCVLFWNFLYLGSRFLSFLCWFAFVCWLVCRCPSVWLLVFVRLWVVHFRLFRVFCLSIVAFQFFWVSVGLLLRFSCFSRLPPDVGVCACLWFSLLVYVFVVVSLSVPIKRKRLYESPRAVTRLTVYRPRRV